MEMEHEKLDLAVDSILSTWHQGRRVLVVLGAGASVSVGIPNMTAVFGELKSAVEELKGRFDRGVGYPDDREAELEKPKIARSLTELCEWLYALASQNAPRSVAAMTLGTLQRAHLRIAEQNGHRWLNNELSKVWTSFSARFVNGDVAGGVVRADGSSETSHKLITEARKRLSAQPLAHPPTCLVSAR